MWAKHDNDVFDAAGDQGINYMLENRSAIEWQPQFGPAHPRTSTGCRYHGEIHISLPQPAVLIPSGANGSERSRIPVAWAIAFRTAGAIPTIGVSPAPADGRSGRLTNTVSNFGLSRNRGTR